MFQNTYKHTLYRELCDFRNLFVLCEERLYFISETQIRYIHMHMSICTLVFRYDMFDDNGINVMAQMSYLTVNHCDVCMSRETVIV